MKMKFMLCCLLTLHGCISFSQYIGVRARYTETRLVDDAPNPPKRENRLILSFFEVSFNGTENIYAPVSLSNYDLWIYKTGLQYGSLMGGVLDSAGNNYPGYHYTAPRAVAYYNSIGRNFIDCDPTTATHYVVNGHELDCGFINVSYWDIDGGTMIPYEAFTAPNICLPYYQWPDPYALFPGNVNFTAPDFPPGPPYNMYNFLCGGPLEQIIRGVLPGKPDTTSVVLPIRFANLRGELRDSSAVIEWSNMTESNVAVYDVERSENGVNWTSVVSVIPSRNDGSQADYIVQAIQTENEAYYRIKATETSGHFFYSSIIYLRKPPDSPVTQQANPALSVYPNPVAGNQFTFRLAYAPKGRYISAIVATDGRQLKQQMIEHDGTADLVRQVDLEGLLPGLYKLVLQGPGNKYSQTIMVNY